MTLEKTQQSSKVYKTLAKSIFGKPRVWLGSRNLTPCQDLGLLLLPHLLGSTLGQFPLQYSALK